MNFAVLTGFFLCLVFLCLVGNQSVKSFNDENGRVFSRYPGSLSLCPNQSLVLLWTHNLSPGNIRWCYWEYQKPGKNDSWSKFIGYDNIDRKMLSINERYEYYRFVDENTPCQNGIWSFGRNVDDVIGSYRMTIVASNSSTYNSPESEVLAEDWSPQLSCPVCPDNPELVSTTSPAVELIGPNSNGKCTGIIVTMVFLLLLIVFTIVMFVLYWKRLLPQACLEQIGINRKPTEKRSLDPEPAEHSPLNQPDNQEIENALSQLQENEKELRNLQTELRLAREKCDEYQRQINGMEQWPAEANMSTVAETNLKEQIAKLETLLQNTQEVKNAEINELKSDNDRLRQQDEEQKELISDLRQKLEQVDQRSEMSLNKNTPSSKIGRTFSSFRRSKRAPNTFSRNDIFVDSLKNTVINKGDDLELSVKVKEVDTDIKWFRYGTNIDNSNDVEIQRSSKDKHKIKLKIKKNSLYMSGHYACLGTCGVKSQTLEATVIVVEGGNEVPLFTKWICGKKRAVEGTKTNLSVTLKGIKIDEISWFCNNQRIDESKEHVRVEKLQDVNNNTISSIVFDPCTVLDTGDYAVVAENELGKTMCTATFEVIEGEGSFQATNELPEQNEENDDMLTAELPISGEMGDA